MKKIEEQTQKTLHTLLSGAHPLAKKYGGKQVFVIGSEVVPFKEGESGLDDFKKLKEKYGQPPTLIFVPKPGASYIFAA